MHKNTEQDHIKIRSGRLKKRPEFLYVAKKGQKWVSETVIVQAVESSEHGYVRYGVTATKKIGNAVIRNRAKRRLRAAMDEILKTTKMTSCDIVLIARHTTPTVSWDKLQKDMQWCFKRLSLTEKEKDRV